MLSSSSYHLMFLFVAFTGLNATSKVILLFNPTLAVAGRAEVSLEVMRLLLRQEKQMRREYAKQQTIGPVLSLDAIRDGGSMDESAWLLDTRQRIDSEVLTAELTDAFCKTLTDSQRSIFRECLIEGKSQSAYAAEHGMTRQSVHDAIALIRKKAKIYFA